MAIVVSALAITPVKATRLQPVDRIALELDGVRENRRFFVIDARNRMVNGKVLGELQQITADYCDGDRRLTLTLPDGSILSDEITLGDEVPARFFSSVRPGRLVHGPLSQALSEVAGQPLRLVEAVAACGAVDRGGAGAVSLISRASLRRLAAQSGATELDARRFRMLIEVDGTPAHAEDEWVGCTVEIGEALVAFRGHVGRCLITSRDPETGEIDFPTLDIVRSYRSTVPSTEPLPFGIYGSVLRAGEIRVADAVAPSARLRDT